MGRWSVTSLPSRVAIMTRSSPSPQYTATFSIAGSIARAFSSTNLRIGNFCSIPTSLQGTFVVYRSPIPSGLKDWGATAVLPDAIADAVLAAASIDACVRSSVNA